MSEGIISVLIASGITASVFAIVFLFDFVYEWLYLHTRYGDQILIGITSFVLFTIAVSLFVYAFIHFSKIDKEISNCKEQYSNEELLE